MAAIKSFTDFEQSKKLAEILPLESADYTRLGKDESSVLTRTYFESCSELKGWIGKDEIHPCWSLAALLGVLPQSVSLACNPKKAYWYYECDRCACFERADNPVDACYRTILKCYELKMFDYGTEKNKSQINKKQPIFGLW